MNNDKFLIGIDGGGTRCRARLESLDGRVLGEGVSGPANVMRCLTTAKASIQHACEQAIASSGMTIASDQLLVGAGLAGANVPSALHNTLQWQHPFAEFKVISDLHAACIGAHAGGEGAVIICGTGSSGTRYQGGRFADLGGHGFLVGDIGSGAWLGLQSIQHTLQVLDGIRTPDSLAAAVLEHLQCDDALALVQVCASYTARDYAALAPCIVPLVNDPTSFASALFRQGVAYLQNLAQQLVLDTSLPLCLIGGLSHIYKAHFSAAIQRHLVDCQQCPEQGAIHFMKQQITLKECGA